MKLVPAKSSERMQIIVNDIKVIIRMYILGLLLEIAIVAALTTLGLWLIGVKYALFLGLLVALLNLIPYVGNLVANAFKSSYQRLGFYFMCYCRRFPCRSSRNVPGYSVDSNSKGGF